MFNNGGYLFGGFTTNIVGERPYLLRTDSLGNLLWTKVYGSNSNLHACFLNSVIELQNQSIIVTGIAREPVAESNSFISKLDGSGNQIWTKIYGQTVTGNGREGINSLCQKPNGNFIASGVSEARAVFGGQYDAIIMEIDSSNGDVIWSNAYGGSEYDNIINSIIDNDGNLVSMFYQKSVGFGNYDMSLVKTDDMGNLIQSKSFGSSTNEYGRDLQLTQDNGIVASFYSGGFGATGEDGLIVKTDANFNSGCNEMDVTIQRQAITINPIAHTFAETTIGIEQTISLTNSSSNIDMETLCSTNCFNCENSKLDTVICFGDSIQINLPNGVDYNWTNYNISDNQIQNPILYPKVDTSYIVFYVNADNCSVLDTINITVNEIPNIVASPSDTTICPINCVPLNSSGGVNYIWSQITNLSNPNIANSTACPLVTTQYIVEGTNSVGCSAKDTVNINVLACCGAFTDFAISDTVLCIGENITITNNSIINTSATHSWTFYGGIPNSFIGENPPSIIYNTSGVYTIEYILSDDCGIDTIEKTIYVFDLPYVETANDTSICDSSTLIYSIGGIDIGGYGYSWSPIIGLDDASIANPSATTNSSEQYIVTVTDEFSACVNYDTVNIIIENMPDSFIVADNNSWCIGDSLTLSSSFAFDSIIWNGTLNSVTFGINLTNNSQFYVEGFLNDCSVLDTINIYLDTIPDINILTNDAIICSGENVNLEVQSSFPIEWNTSEITNIINISPTINTEFYAIATNGFCNANDTVLINVLALPNINITGPDSICINSIANLTASGATSYLWTNADNTNGASNSLTIENDTIIYVTGTNICTNTDSIYIYSIDSNYVNITGVDSVCEGDNITLTANGNGNFVWDTGETTHNISETVYTSTNFTISSGAGICPIATDTFDVVAIPTPFLSTNGPIVTVEGQLVPLEVDGAINYTWSPSIGLSCIDCNNPNLTANQSIIYYITGYNEFCNSNDSIEIIVNFLDECFAIPDAFSPNNDNVNDTFFPIPRTGEVAIQAFRIYNRRGGLIYDDILPWDGRFKNKIQSIGVYTYIVTYSCNGEVKNLMGNVTIIK